MIAILQPFIPHYREDFFKKLLEQLRCDLFVYEAKKSAEFQNISLSDINVHLVWNLIFKQFLLYSIAPFLKNKYSTLVLMLHFGHISTWGLLLTKKLHRRKIILWGHGISVKRYVKEEINPDPLLKLMIQMADVIWLYTDKEVELWKKHFPDKNIVSLNNTISDVDEVLSLDRSADKESLKRKYNICQPLVYIFCARFDNPYRRVDLLEKVIQRLDSNKFAFIVIGDGNSKPDFSKYKNVFDFGKVYDRDLKTELFTIADAYFQPAWVGLSIVEAMAYGKPVLTFKRTVDVLQCVEYSYIKNEVTGIIFKDLEDCINQIESLDNDKFQILGRNAKEQIKASFRIGQMVESAVKSLAQ